MKRQTQIMLSVFLAVAAGMGAAMVTARRTGGIAGMRQEHFGVANLQIPDSFGPGVRHLDRGWNYREFQSPSLGTLRLGTEQQGGQDFQAACRFWFSMPSYQAGPVNYAAGRYQWFYKEVDLFGPGAYAVRRQGKGLRLICAFQREGLNHWVGLDTRMNFTAPKDAFDHMLLSMRLEDGSSPAASLGGSLASVARENRYRFFQPA